MADMIFDNSRIMLNSDKDTKALFGSSKLPNKT